MQQFQVSKTEPLALSLPYGFPRLARLSRPAGPLLPAPAAALASMAEPPTRFCLHRALQAALAAASVNRLAPAQLCLRVEEHLAPPPFEDFLEG